MRACSTSGGGVMFISDDVGAFKAKASQKTPVSYKDLVGEEKSLTALDRLELFAKKVARLKKDKKVA